MCLWTKSTYGPDVPCTNARMSPFEHCSLHYCKYKDCDSENSAVVPDSNYCADHICKFNASCLEGMMDGSSLPTCSKHSQCDARRCRGIRTDRSSPFCNKHAYCIKVGCQRWCLKVNHLCPDHISTCFLAACHNEHLEDAWYCKAHTCKFKGCFEQRTKWAFCGLHQDCQYPGCSSKAEACNEHRCSKSGCRGTVSGPGIRYCQNGMSQ